MTIIYVLIPVGLILLALAVWAFFWAVRSGQMDDLEGPGHAVLMDDDSPPGRTSADIRETTEKRETRDAGPGSE